MNTKIAATLIALCLTLSVLAQSYTAKRVDSLYQSWPTQKHDLCPACKLWINPIFKAIADTSEHRVVVSYMICTRQHLQMQEALKLPRKGIFSAWHPVNGQPRMDAIYRAANRQSADEIAYGHHQPWILCAWCPEGAILSDTQDFNESMEYQGQNVGTEIAAENEVRKLITTTDTVLRWSGSCGNGRQFDGVVLPAFYWELIKYNGKVKCYWMKNSPDQKQSLLPSCEITYPELISKLGFDPARVLF